MGADNDSHRSLFLPDILPCPGSEQCAFHASIFGSGDQNETPNEWRCPKCEKLHLTTIAPPRAVEPSTPTSRSRLETLPTELILHVIGYLPATGEAALAFTSHALNSKVGTRAWSLDCRERDHLTTLLAKDTLTYAKCSPCGMLRPVSSDLAWPLLKRHKEERGVSPSVYAVSEFLAIKMVDKHVSSDGPQSLCGSLLTCAGVYMKPWALPDNVVIKDAGFSSDDVDQGLAIGYNASGRIAERAQKLVTHVRYHIDLPRQWTSFSIAQRSAILRKFYLCPHTYAAKVQHRDPEDPMFPSDSSIVHWLPHQGPMPESWWMCSQCPSEFRSQVEASDDQNGPRSHFIAFDVWHESSKSCADGMSETTFCRNSNNNHGSQLGRIRKLFEAATPL